MADRKASVKVHTQQGDEPLSIPTPEPSPPPTDGPLAPPVLDQPQQSAATTGTGGVLNEDGTAPDVEYVAAKRGKVFVTYRGVADRLVHEDRSGDVPIDYSFAPGVPVEVPKDIADALLTTPFEEFEVTEAVPAPPTVEE